MSGLPTDSAGCDGGGYGDGGRRLRLRQRLAAEAAVMTEADRIAGLVKQYPKGCPRPAGYLAFHSWAEAQIAQGVYQSWDERSQRWVFPQESTRVYFGEGEAT